MPMISVAVILECVVNSTSTDTVLSTMESFVDDAEAEADAEDSRPKGDAEEDVVRSADDDADETIEGGGTDVIGRRSWRSSREW